MFIKNPLDQELTTPVDGGDVVVLAANDVTEVANDKVGRQILDKWQFLEQVEKPSKRKKKDEEKADEAPAEEAKPEEVPVEETVPEEVPAEPVGVAEKAPAKKGNKRGSGKSK